MLRRCQLTHFAILALLGLRVLSVEASTLNEDGLHQQSWFLQQSFLELGDDWDEANANKRGLAIVWELKGCPACKRMHDELLQNQKLVKTLTRHFDVVQLNFTGLRTVVDFDGKELPERDLAAKNDIAGTPAWQFFPAGTKPINSRSDAHRIMGVPSLTDFIKHIEQAATTNDAN